MSTEQDKTTAMKASLLAWLKTKMPDAKDLIISDLETPGMGLSSETYLFDMNWEESGQQKTLGIVLRAAPQGDKVFPEYEIGHQFHIMRILKDTGGPVARMVLLEEDPTVIGAPFFLMEKLEGDVPQDFPSYHGSGMYFEATPEVRTKMWWETVDTLVKIHKLDWRSMGFSFLGVPRDKTDAIDRQLAYWDNYLNNWLKDDTYDSFPTMESSLDWLKENRYVPDRLTLCWGDARIGNTLYSRPDRDVIAIMDWEMAFIGDPECDLVWMTILDKQHSKGYRLPKLPGTPEDEEIRYGMTTIAVMKKFIKQGIPMEEDMLLNNFATQHLADLLGLPAPGAKKKEAYDLSKDVLSVQIHFTGPGGYDWYIVSDKGKATRYEGTVENPNCTITVSLEDWQAVQNGELNRLDAWSTGRLVVNGHLGVMTLLEDVIAELQ
ncbi:MAG: phosphotransferase [Deltaproteobacteria bacterium]|nr:phosphotransferase [Deltaproteobacteria bacterium]